MKEISDKLYNQLKRLGIIDADTRSHNVGASDYSKHIIQPWSIWIDYNLNAFDADIIKRVLRTKEGEDRITDYEKIIHICQERIRQLEHKEPISLEFTIEIPNDAPVLAMLREEDKKIHKGDMFECIKYFAIGEHDEIIFTRGKSYVSESDGCITDNTGTQRWCEKFYWQEYFKRI